MSKLFGYKIGQIAHGFKQAVRNECEKRGIPSSYFHILKCLGSHDGKVSQSKIVEYAKFKKSTVSQTLSSMENEGLIVRVKDVDDARITYIELTKEGRKEALKIKDVFETIEGELNKSLTEDDMDKLNIVLDKLIVSLERRNNNA